MGGHAEECACAWAPHVQQAEMIVGSQDFTSENACLPPNEEVARSKSTLLVKISWTLLASCVPAWEVIGKSPWLRRAARKTIMYGSRHL